MGSSESKQCCELPRISTFAPWTFDGDAMLSCGLPGWPREPPQSCLIALSRHRDKRSLRHSLIFKEKQAAVFRKKSRTDRTHAFFPHCIQSEREPRCRVSREVPKRSTSHHRVSREVRERSTIADRHPSVMSPTLSIRSGGRVLRTSESKQRCEFQPHICTFAPRTFDGDAMLSYALPGCAPGTSSKLPANSLSPSQQSFTEP